MFRILYLVVATAGLIWILQSRPIWLDPVRVVEQTAEPAASKGPEPADAILEETYRRTRIVIFATFGVILAGEIWCLLAGRLKLFQRT